MFKKVRLAKKPPSVKGVFYFPRISRRIYRSADRYRIWNRILDSHILISAVSPHSVKRAYIMTRKVV